MLDRFTACACLTAKARDILNTVLLEDNGELKQRSEIEFLYRSTEMTASLCKLLADYMELYVQLDNYFESGETLPTDAVEECREIIKNANKWLQIFKNDGYIPFDPFGGIYVRREEIFEFVSYSAGQMIKSIRENERHPKERRPQKESNWW